MKSRFRVAAIVLLASTAGCVQNYAAREISQGAALGTLIVTNAPAGARVILDGKDQGPVVPTGIPLTLGRHDVSVQLEGRSIYGQAVYASAGARIEMRVQ